MATWTQKDLSRQERRDRQRLQSEDRLWRGRHVARAISTHEVYNDRTETIGNNFTTTVQQGNHETTVDMGDQSNTVSMGNQSEHRLDGQFRRDDFDGQPHDHRLAGQDRAHGNAVYRVEGRAELGEDSTRWG